MIIQPLNPQVQIAQVSDLAQWDFEAIRSATNLDTDPADAALVSQINMLIDQIETVEKEIQSQ